MTDRNDWGDREEEQFPAEGVRIIRAEEAQAALEAGAAIGRRPDDELRFGDVPPAPAGPRPAHRFPLPTSVDPATVPRPPVVARPRGEDRGGGRRSPGSDPNVEGAEADVASDELGETPAATEESASSEPVTGGAGGGGPLAASPGHDPGGSAPSPAAPPAALAPAEPPESGSGTSSWWPPANRSTGRTPDEVAESDFSSDFPSSFSTGTASSQRGADWAGDDWTWSGSEETGSPEPAESPGGAAGGLGPSGRPAAPAQRGAAPTDPSEGDDAGPGADAPGPGWWSDAEAAPTWSPPAAWQPAGEQHTGVPTWESPLDDAEGISPAPSSWTPPEAWADSPPAGFARSRISGPVFASAARRVADEVRAESGPSDSTEEPDFEPSPGETPRPPTPDAAPAPPASPNEGITVTGGFGTDLPHWTDPPTGEVPRLLPGDEEGEQSDDLEAWRAVSGDTGVRWRDDADDWNDIGGIDELGSDETRVGAMDPSRPEPGDLYSFDEDFERLDEERSGQHRLFINEYAEEEELESPDHLTRSPRSSSGRAGLRGGRIRGAITDTTGTSGGDRDLTSAVAVGVGLIVLLIVGYAVGSLALLVLSAAILLACSIEAFAMVQRRGFKPATLLGLAGVVGVVFAAYWRGTEALSIVTAVVFVATMLWYLLGVVDARPLANVSASLMIYLWIGFLGSFAALLLRAPHGRGLFLGAVLPTVAADVVAYVIGSRIGSRTLAPWVSPSKTIEGVIAGGIAALVVGAIIGHEVAPWGGIKHGLLLGLVIAVLAPVGDLFESMVKRDLAVKDSGSALPGHGGLLDRFDSMLVALPAAYYLASLFNLHL